MLKDLGWESLADRRRDLRLVLLYKIVNHFDMVTTDDILIPADLRTRANHPYKFRTITANTTIIGQIQIQNRQSPIYLRDLHYVPPDLATSSYSGRVDEWVTELSLLPHHVHGTGCRQT